MSQQLTEKTHQAIDVSNKVTAQVRSSTCLQTLEKKLDVSLWIQYPIAKNIGEINEACFVKIEEPKNDKANI